MKKTILTSILSFVLSFAIVAGSGIAVVNNVVKSNSEGSENHIEKPQKGRVNILLLGTDASSARTDTMMLLSINKDDKKIYITSIPRDSRIQLKGRPDKLNASIPRGNLDVLLENIKKLTGAPINYYAMVDFMGFRNIIDILGGVEFDVPMNMTYNDPTQNLHIDLKKGVQTLDGKQAEMVVRYRKGYAMGDYRRIQVQQAFMKELIKQKLKPEYITKAGELFSEISKNCQTNAALKDVLANISAAKLFTAEDAIEVIPYPGNSKYIGSISYFIPNVTKAKTEIAPYFGGDPSIMVPFGEEYLDGHDTNATNYNKPSSSSSNKNSSSSSNSSSKNTTAKKPSSTTSESSKKIIIKTREKMTVKIILHQMTIKTTNRQIQTTRAAVRTNLRIREQKILISRMITIRQIPINRKNPIIPERSRAGK